MKKGYFYLIKLDGDRIKFGYTTNIARRLKQCQTYVPDATLIKLWDCHRVWYEQKAIEYLGKNLSHIGGEVFSCSDIPMLFPLVEDFFQTQVPLLEKARWEARKQKERDYWDQFGGDEVRRQMEQALIEKRSSR